MLIPLKFAIFNCHFVHPWKLTWLAGKSPVFNRKYIDLFMVNVPTSHISFRGGNYFLGLEKKSLGGTVWSDGKLKCFLPDKEWRGDRGIDDDANDSHHKSVVLEDLDLCLVVPRKSLSLLYMCEAISFVAGWCGWFCFMGCPWTYPADGRASRNDS